MRCSGIRQNSGILASSATNKGWRLSGILANSATHAIFLGGDGYVAPRSSGIHVVDAAFRCRADRRQPPTTALPPLLYVKLIGPKGMQVTCFRGAAPGQSFATPCTIGIRPGYSVRLALTIPEYPNTTFYPTLEARGSLLMANQFRQADYPAALVFRADDFARIQANATLYKVVVLERPETAVPAATKPDEPLEIAVVGNLDPLHEAFERGQPLLLMQMGGRELTSAEIANVPGTLLFPGEKALAMPLVAPWVAWQCFPVIDPRTAQEIPMISCTCRMVVTWV